MLLNKYKNQETRSPFIFIDIVSQGKFSSCKSLRIIVFNLNTVLLILK